MKCTDYANASVNYANTAGSTQLLSPKFYQPTVSATSGSLIVSSDLRNGQWLLRFGVRRTADDVTFYGEGLIYSYTNNIS